MGGFLHRRVQPAVRSPEREGGHICSRGARDRRYDYNQGSGTEPTRSIDAGRLWTGGVATALVAALVAVVGVLIARGLFDVPVLAPSSEGSLGNASTFRLAGLAAGAALLATGLLHLLLVSTPRPRQFFTWIVALATIAAALAPFLTDADLAEKVRGVCPSSSWCSP